MNVEGEMLGYLPSLPKCWDMFDDERLVAIGTAV